MWKSCALDYNSKLALRQTLLSRPSRGTPDRLRPRGDGSQRATAACGPYLADADARLAARDAPQRIQAGSVWALSHQCWGS